MATLKGTPTSLQLLPTRHSTPDGVGTGFTTACPAKAHLNRVLEQGGQGGVHGG